MIRKTSLILPLLVILLFILAYLPVWQALIKTWSGSEDYSHGFFIVPISLYLVWQKREALSELPVHGSSWGLFVITASLLMYIFAVFAEVKTLSSLSMVPFLCGIIIYQWGFHVFRILLFPVAFLLFMIPVPAQIYSALTIPLQLFVSKSSVALASMVGVPVYSEGNVIHLADRTLRVVKACSGMRSIISLMALSAVFGYVTLHSNLLRVLLFLSGIVVAIIVNIIRVFLILVAYQYAGIDLTVGSYHTVLGLFVFVAALGILGLIKWGLSYWDARQQES